jgi:hypothetical protein
MDFLEDIEGAEHLQNEYGERFKGYYLFKEFLRTQTLPLGYENLSYRFNISKFEIRFIMPSCLIFSGGTVSYSLTEREFGIFRFPRHHDGSFSTPMNVNKVLESINNLSDSEVQRLLNSPQPLVFDAYRIPTYGFEYIHLTDSHFKDIEMLTTQGHSLQMREEYDSKYKALLDGVKRKITSGCNFLLILQNVLDRNWKDLEEVAEATGNIIHI